MDSHDPYSPPLHDTPPSKKSGAPKFIKWFAFYLVCVFSAVLISDGLSSNHYGATTMQTGQRQNTTVSELTVDTNREMTIPEIYESYSPSCVGITVDAVTTNLFGQRVTRAAAGSGFVLSADGYIMTNYHVVENANAISVSFVDGTTYPAIYIGGEPANDIAVIKIEAQDLKPVVLGNSEQMHVGEPVLTIGNPLGELTFSLSDGVVSALDRSITMEDGRQLTMLQTNSPINPGNSGGPLFNTYGEVIGIVTSKYSGGYQSQNSIEGLGFAIPITQVKDMVYDIIASGYVTNKPFFGISVQSVSEEVQQYGIPAGANVVYAPEELSAYRGGIREGDIITAINDIEITSDSTLIAQKNNFQAGDTVNITIFRKGSFQDFSIVLDEDNQENRSILNNYIEEQLALEAPMQNGQFPNGSFIP